MSRGFVRWVLVLLVLPGPTTLNGCEKGQEQRRDGSLTCPEEER